jgi:SET domain
VLQRLYAQLERLFSIAAAMNIYVTLATVPAAVPLLHPILASTHILVLHAHRLHACTHTAQVSPTYVWAEEDLSLLEGSPVISATVSMKRKLEAEYATLANGLFARKQQLFPADTYSCAAFQWAFSMLFSRAIRLTSLNSGKAIALIPYADLFNHNPYANSYIDARETGWITKKDEMAVYSDRSYKRMEQVHVMHSYCYVVILLVLLLLLILLLLVLLVLAQYSCQ